MAKKKSKKTKRKSTAANNESGSSKKKVSKGPLAEVDLLNDVPLKKCSCMNLSTNRQRYKPHLCPIEPIVKHSLYEPLHSSKIPEPSIAKNQVLRRVKSACLTTSPALTGELISVEKTKMKSAQVEQMLAKYLKLLERFEDQMDEKLGPVYSRIAALCIAQEDFEAALQYAKKSTTIDPYHAAAWYQHGYALFRLARYEEASNIFLKGLSYSPSSRRIQSALESTMVFQAEDI